MRFAMTAKTLVRERAGDGGIREITARNVAKVTRFRPGGEDELERTVSRMETARGMGRKEEGTDEVDEVEREKGGRREPWEPFARVRQRLRDQKEDQRPVTALERRELMRPPRDPNTGRRARVMKPRGEKTAYGSY